MKQVARVLTRKAILTAASTVLATGLLAQTAQYGDLELSVMGNGNQAAVNIPVKAVDPDRQDTTYLMTDENSQAYFDSLYIYTSVGLEENKENNKTFKGQVQFHNILGNYLGQTQANANGSVNWAGAGNTASSGIYIAKDETGTAMKFFYNQRPVLLGKPISTSQNSFKATKDTFNTYELWADGRTLEFNPFDVYMELADLYANQVNEVSLAPPVVPDGPASGVVTIDVNGEPAGDSSELALVRTGQTDTSYFYSVAGEIDFSALSHPFGNFTREYTMLIRSNDADSNWFHQETNIVNIALGDGNDFTFTPASITDEERTANITLEIILSNGTPASENAEVKAYRLGETDTSFAYTNEDGFANFSRLVNPFQADAHEFAINSDSCTTNLFLATSEMHDLYVGQNDIEMNPDPVPTNFGRGPARTWHGSALIPGTEVKIWRLNNTIDTVSYTSSTSGLIFYENLPLEGDSSLYVFKSGKIMGTDSITSLDTFNIVTGMNPMKNIYLSLVPEFNFAEGTVREFYEQDSMVQGVEIEIWERNNDTLFNSCITNDTGYWHIDSIPLGFEAVIKMIGLSDHFNRINDFDFPEDVLTPGEDSTTILNMLHVPIDMVIPQTANDPAPETLVADPAEVAELAYGDEKNGEEIARFENRIHLTNFWTPSDSAIYFQAEEAIDSLFYGGQGSPLVLVPNSINITTYHILNYNINVGFPGELGWNLTQGGGNVTTPIHSSIATGGYILGGQIHITGDLASRIKELQHRRKQRGDVTSRPSYGNPGNPTMPNIKDRAYDHAIDINLTARVITGNEVFPLDGLTTSTKSANKFQTGEMKQAYLMGPPKPPKSTDMFEDAVILYETK